MEPRFGYKNLTKAKRDGKVKAFFSLLIPTETAGTIELTGCKVIEGGQGLFISLPSRAVTSSVNRVVNADTKEITTAEGGTKYYENVRFESNDKSLDVKRELNDRVLPLIREQLLSI